MTVISCLVQCNDKSGAKANDVFWDYSRVNDKTGKGSLNVFLKRFQELGSNLPDCRGQCYNNGASIKGKEAGFQARLLQIKSRAFYVSCTKHSLNLVVVDSAKSYTEVLLFFSELTQLYALL